MIKICLYVKLTFLLKVIKKYEEVNAQKTQ